MLRCHLRHHHRPWRSTHLSTLARSLTTEVAQNPSSSKLQYIYLVRKIGERTNKRNRILTEFTSPGITSVYDNGNKLDVRDSLKKDKLLLERVFKHLPRLKSFSSFNVRIEQCSAALVTVLPRELPGIGNVRGPETVAMLRVSLGSGAVALGAGQPTLLDQSCGKLGSSTGSGAAHQEKAKAGDVKETLPRKAAMRIIRAASQSGKVFSRAVAHETAKSTVKHAVKWLWIFWQGRL